MLNKNSLDTLCAALCYALGIDAPEQAVEPNADLCKYIDEKLNGQKVNRIFMYNPDAIAQWIYEKYNSMFDKVKSRVDVEVPMCTVMPSVTPVCFGTMYTGAQPSVHGIETYTKPVITIDTIFDALIRASKKAAIVSTGEDSMSKIFLEREMDYFIFDSIPEANAKAEQLIEEDKYDFIAVYDGNYDGTMHRFGPESQEALTALEHNVNAFAKFSDKISKHWQQHKTLIGFAMDHGCHEIDGGCGSHGLAMEEDLNIVHLYKVI